MPQVQQSECEPPYLQQDQSCTFVRSRKKRLFTANTRSSFLTKRFSHTRKRFVLALVVVVVVDIAK